MVAAFSVCPGFGYHPPMTQTNTTQRKTAGANGRHKPFTVSRSALASHLDVGPTQISRLETDGILRRENGGYPLDASRIAYIRHLRRARRQISPRGEIDIELQKHRARLMQLKIGQQEKMLMYTADHQAFVEDLTGLVLTKLSGWSTRLGGNDLPLRRRAEALVIELRREMTEAALARRAEELERHD